MDADQTLELAYWIALLRLPKLTLKTLYTLKAEHPSWVTCSRLPAVNLEAAFEEIDKVHRLGGQIICISDLRYPARLKQLSAPPPVLMVKGNIHLLSHRQIAIVGSRNASLIGLENAKRMAQALAKAGLIITSGLARGIDAASHLGALEAGKETIAVMGTGLDQIYPKSHKALSEKITEQGLLVTEYFCGTPPRAEFFPRRNRIISGLSEGVLVVEASLQSGSLITARYALEQGREIFAIPGSIHNPCSKGCHSLLKQGAKLVETVEDILEEVAPLLLPKAENQTKKEPIFLCEKDRKVYDSIDFTLTNIDSIIARSELALEQICPILISLELKNAIASVPGGYVKLPTL